MEQLHKFFNIPSYYSNLVSDIHSENLMPLFNDNPIDYMRQLYRTDSKLFYNVRDELVLRGIGFQTEFQNNYLLDRTYEIHHILSKADNTFAFKKIDFAMLGANNFIERFNVRSDLFFTNMPLEGILHFTQGVSLVLLQDLFKEAGFSIVPVNGYKASTIQAIGGNYEVDNKEEKEKQMRNRIKERSFMKVPDEIPLQDVFVKHFYKDEIFIEFIKYCQRKGIRKFSELTIDFIERFQYQKDVSRESMIQALELYHEIHNVYAMEFAVPDAAALLQNNSFMSIVEYIRGSYLEFIDDFYTADGLEIYQADFPFEKVEKVVQRAADLSERNHLHNTMESVVQKAVTLFQSNPFRSVVEFIEDDYLGFIDDFYSAEGLGIHQSDYPFERAQRLCQHAIDNAEEILAEKERQELNELRTEIEAHPKFKYILSYSLAEIQVMFKTKWDKSLNLDLYLFDVLEDKSYIDLLKDILVKLSKIKDIQDVLDNISKKLKPRELQVLELRQTKTLQEVGDIINVTRERIRQIEAKGRSRLNGYRRQLKIKLYFRYCTEHSKLLTLDEFMHAFGIEGESNKAILSILFELDDSIMYLKELDRYMLTADYEELRESIEKIDYSQPIIKVDELKQLFHGDTFSIAQEVVDLLIRSHGYKLVENLYVKEKISIIARINYLFDHVIKEPLEMDDKGYNLFKQYMEDTFEIPFESTRRAAAARVAAGENVVLVDGNTYATHDDEAITDEFLAKMEEAIDSRLLTLEYADPRWLYKEYKPLMKQIGLFSPVHLYSIIQLYLGDKFETGHRNTLYIYPKDADRLDSEAILLNYLQQNGHEAKRDSILEDLSWKTLKLDQLLGRIDTAIMVSNYTVKAIESFNFTEEELTELKNAIERELGKGYVFTYDLQFELLFDEKLESLMERCKLTDDVTLAAITKWLLPNVNGFSKLLYWSDSPITKIEHVIAEEFPEFIARNELLEFVESKGYADQTVYRLPGDILNDGLFYNYTSTSYINAKLLSFTDEVKQSLASYLQEQFESKAYCPIFDLVGYSQALKPITSYGWTELLIGQFAEQIGYRKIQANIDYRFDKPVLVRNDSHIENYEQLVLHIVKTEYSGRYHEEDLAKYLVSRKIAHNPRRLTNEIYNSPLFKFDSFGFFEIRGDADGIN